jgi:hypothetical protein
MTRAGKLAVVLCAWLAWLGCASHADELRSSNQIPKAALANAVILVSFANQPLKLSYLDGDWKEIQISPAQTVMLPSSGGGAVSIAFHDGAGIQSMQLVPGAQYILYWDSQRSRWSIDSDAVMRKGTEFRSR